MRIGTHLKYVESSPRVSGACQDGAKEFAGRRPRLAGRLSGVAEMLARSWEGLAGLNCTLNLRIEPFNECFEQLVFRPISGLVEEALKYALIWMERMKEVRHLPLLRYLHDGSLQQNSFNQISQLLRRGREKNRRGWPKL
ncbi:hypothetical protein BHM03_00004628 [Ensete ventricosum]|nr:hypothetical protein BHM03_00004628 [Ensete ventricosum]